MDKPLILVTNDDGVGAKGLQSAIRIARRFGRVLVVAPESSQSGMAHAITMSNPLYLRTLQKSDELTVYACSGTPVDCVKMAFDYLLEGRRPLLTLSGINHGSNSAVSVLYSGTMGAAIEASFYEAPAVGLSLLDHSPDADFAAAEHFGVQVVERLLAAGPALPLCWNVNFPNVKPADIQGIKMCRQARGYWKEEFEVRRDPRGKEYYWLTGDFLNQEPEAQDTDEWALKHHYVSVVPVHIDLTHYEQLAAGKDLFG